MPKPILLIVLLLQLFHVSAEAQKQKAEFDSLLVIPPVVDFGVIRTADHPETDSVMSKKAELTILKVVQEMLSEFTQPVIPNSASRPQNSYEAVGQIIRAHDKSFKPKLEEVPIPQTFLKYMDSLKFSYGLCIGYQGFVRTKDNEVNGFRKRGTLNLLGASLFNFAPGVVAIPGKVNIESSAATMICFLINRKDKRLVYFGKTSTIDENPLDIITIKRNLRYLLMSYFL